MADFLKKIYPHDYPDFALVASNGQEFPCHRAVMAVASLTISTYLETGVGDGMKDDKSKFVLSEYDEKTVELVIDWIYEYAKFSPQDDIFDFLKLSDYLRIVDFNRENIINEYFDSFLLRGFQTIYSENEQLSEELWRYSQKIDISHEKACLIRVFAPWKFFKKFFSQIQTELEESSPNYETIVKLQSYFNFYVTIYILIHQGCLPRLLDKKQKILMYITYISATSTCRRLRLTHTTKYNLGSIWSQFGNLNILNDDESIRLAREIDNLISKLSS